MNTDTILTVVIVAAVFATLLALIIVDPGRYGEAEAARIRAERDQDR